MGQVPEPGSSPTRTTTEPLADLVLSDVVTSALHRAEEAARLRDRPIDTQTVLVALAEVDTDGDWTHLSIATVPLAQLADPCQPDPDPAPAGQWNGVPLTGTCAGALARAARISCAYERGVLRPGELVLGLIADPRSGAAQAFGVGCSISHPDLIAVVQADLCRATLQGLERHMGFDES
ncbi:hypothetical protein [Streptomyces sp. NPDC003480]